jgi:hypothetical protein
MRSIAPTGFNTFDFRTMVVANYTRITFDYNASVVGNGSVYWFTNYDSYNVISGAGTVSGLELSPGDTFGFRLVSYNNGQPVNSAILTVSNLTASIPEPSTSVGLMGITALMIAMFLGDRGRGARRS